MKEHNIAIPLITVTFIILVIAAVIICCNADLMTVPLANSQSQQLENIKININTADPNDLQLLPGIGASLAEKIVAYRQRYGSFKSIEEIMNVKGVGSKLFENIKPFISVSN